METETTETPTGLDIAAASDQIGQALFPETPSQETGPDDAPATVPPSTEAAASPPVPEAPAVRPAPKSWAKDVHEHWTKIDPKAQEYIEKREKDFLDGLEQYKKEAEWAKTIRQTLNPYQQTLKGLRVDEVQAIQSLFNADHRLRYEPTEQRLDYFKQLAKNYGVDLSSLAKPAENQAPVDPEIQSIKQQLTQMQRDQEAQRQAALQEAQAKVNQEVAVFASDEKAHPYFNDVTDDIAMLLQANPKLSLQEAYDKAVRANEVTWAKEVARIQTETEAKLKENARLEALPKKKAAAANVKSRDTQRSPTEPLGTMEDTLKATYAQIKARGA